MCLIIHNPKGKEIPSAIIDNAAFTNPDGFGIFYHDTKQVIKTMSWDKMDDLLYGSGEGRPFTCHFRYATSGPISKRNCHPFVIDDTYALMMNGTIERLKSDKSVDTVKLCKILAGLDHGRMVSIMQTYACRFALLNKRTGEVTIINRDLWTKRDGVLYSKGNCFPNPSSGTPKPHPFKTWETVYEDTSAWGEEDYDGDWSDVWEGREICAPPAPEAELETVAVYGTLKSGFGNHERHLWNSYCLGCGVTEEPYPLLVQGLPYLLDRKGHGEHVEVEAYRVDADTLASLDRLEGHPDWYCRRKIRIRLDKGGVVSAWIYFMPDHMVTDTGEYEVCYGG